MSIQKIPRPSVKEIRQVFPSAMAAGIALPEIGQGLVIVFNQLADFCDELKLPATSAKMKHEALFNLTKAFGFIVLKNCTAQRLPDEDASKLSSGKDFDGKFIQDPYHYDVTPPERDLALPAEGYMSGIYKKTAAAREADTFFALEADVKLAIPQLDRYDLGDDVSDALGEMAKPDYHFRLYNPIEGRARQIIRKQYPEFVDDVFALIPEGRKYRQSWLQDQWDILLCANVFSGWVHARPTGHLMTNQEDRANPLGGLYLHRGL